MVSQIPVLLIGMAAAAAPSSALQPAMGDMQAGVLRIGVSLSQERLPTGWQAKGAVGRRLRKQ
jgi:hypothetical protein